VSGLPPLHYSRENLADISEPQVPSNFNEEKLFLSLKLKKRKCIGKKKSLIKT